MPAVPDTDSSELPPGFPRSDYFRTFLRKPVHEVDKAVLTKRAQSERSEKAKLAWQIARQQSYPVGDRRDLVQFGVEVECFFPQEAFTQLGLVLGNYHNGALCPATVDPQRLGWKCESDGSLGHSPPPSSAETFVGCEFVSPPLRGIQGFEEIFRFVKLLQAKGAVITRSCGLHVSVGLAGVTGGESVHEERCRNFVRRFMHFVSLHENGMLQIGSRRSRVGNYYCKSVKDIGSTYGIMYKSNVRNFMSLINYYGRYRTVNLSVLNTTRPRFEFRVFAGTVNPLKVIGYVAVALGLVHKAAEAAIPPEQKFGNWELPKVIGDSKATLRLHTALWTRHKEPKYGFPTGVWEKYGKKILKNQRWNGRVFREGMRGNASPGNGER